MRTRAGHVGRRLLAPEVVQTSAMDCGPAALKCLLDGFGIRVSYGRLREACQTDVDGTSIDTMETVAVQLGLEAEQVMIPSDHLLLPAARALPAIVVVRLPSGVTHFVVCWRRHGGLVQLMDPGTGRRWETGRRFLDELYIHLMPVAAAAWREWAVSDEFLEPLRHRMTAVGCNQGERERLLGAAVEDPGWQNIAAVDAATRMTEALLRCGALRRGAHAARLLERSHGRALAGGESPQVIPEPYFTVQPHDPSENGEEQVLLRGAVLVRVLGRRDAPAKARADASAPAAERGEASDAAPPLSPELVAALQETPSRPGRDLLRLLREDGLLAPLALTLALALGAGGLMVEALVLRGLFDISAVMGLTTQRLVFVGAVLFLLIGLVLLELPITAGVLRLGRHLETRLRLAFLRKIPRLGDRYFHSRLTSDMAERSHVLPAIRGAPTLGAQLLRAVFGLALTVGGLVWLDPGSAPIAVTVAAVSVFLPLAMQPLLTERDLRVRSHGGALSRFYLDALLGLVPVRTHGAERAVRREHESLLVEWAHASKSLLRVAVPVDGLLALAGMALAGWLLVDYLGRLRDTRDLLLFAYWALNLPALGRAAALTAQQYPAQRNVTLRLLEPLGAPEEGEARDRTPVTFQAASTAPPTRGVAVRLEGVAVRAAGHTILDQIDLTIEAGTQLAVVGPSGAGKSSLVGLLLGWHRPSEGRVLVDGQPLSEELAQLRRETAWVDPAVHLWNRSLLRNLSYGVDHGNLPALGEILEAANLRRVLEALPEGLQTSLGEGGALVSGGEGQRVRLGRSMGRRGARLVILDEPFRGLDREQRRELLSRARQWWQGATMICVTHDLAETLSFGRVVVIEAGRIVEDGTPAALVERPGGRYRALLDEEGAVRDKLWRGATWRRLRLENGRLAPDGERSAP